MNGVSYEATVPSGLGSVTTLDSGTRIPHRWLSSTAARAEGARELIAQQLETKTKEAIEAHLVAAVAQRREGDLQVQLERSEAELGALRTSIEANGSVKEWQNSCDDDAT